MLPSVAEMHFMFITITVLTVVHYWPAYT